MQLYLHALLSGQPAGQKILVKQNKPPSETSLNRGFVNKYVVEVICSTNI
jgi:hypothetical protein